MSVSEIICCNKKNYYYYWTYERWGLKDGEEKLRIGTSEGE
jgi:hypothetical protein